MAGGHLSVSGTCIFIVGAHLFLFFEYQQAQAQTITASPSASSDCIRGAASGAQAVCRIAQFKAPRRPDPAPSLYGDFEYLLWWVKGAPLSAPLVSTGPAANDEGFLVNSQSRVLYGAPFSPAVGGNNTQNFPGFSGGRLTLGYWLDEGRHLAVEARGFMLQSRTARFEAQGNSLALGSSGIRIPVFNTVPYTPGSETDLTLSENGLPVSIPGIIAGGVVITNSLRFWGTDATGVFNVYRFSSWELNVLAGFRYLDLSESFNLTLSIAGLANTIFEGQSGYATDKFETRNQFYGADLGLRGRTFWGPVSLELSGRVALGVSHEVLNVSGMFQATNYTAASGQQGIFAQPSNSGERASNDFAVVPEFGAKIGYDVTPSVRVTLGYDFLYYSRVVRPGDQLDRNLPKGQIFQQGGSSVSSTSPTALFNKTDFFAQGLSVGLAVRF